MESRIGTQTFPTNEGVSPFTNVLPLTNRIFNRIPVSKVAGASNQKWTYLVEPDTNYVLVMANSATLTSFVLNDQDGTQMTSSSHALEKWANGFTAGIHYMYFKTASNQTGIEVECADSTELSTIRGMLLYPMDMGYVRGIRFSTEGTYNLMYGKPTYKNGVHSLYKAGADYYESPTRIEVYTAGTIASDTNHFDASGLTQYAWYDLVFYLDFVELTTGNLVMTLTNAICETGTTFTAVRGYNKVRIFTTSTTAIVTPNATDGTAITSAMGTAKIYKVTLPTLELVTVKY